MLNDLKISFVNIDQQSLSDELKAKAKYYANVVHWTLIYALPLFWLLDYSFLSSDWVSLLLIRIIIVFLSHAIYVYGGLKKNNWDIEVTMSFVIGLNTVLYAAICATLPISFMLPYFLLFAVFLLLLNIVIFWKPFYSVIQCFIAYFLIIVLFKLINKYDGFDALVNNGGGVFFVLSLFSCLFGFNRYQLGNREIAKNLLIEMANNRLIDQNEKIIYQQNEIKETNRKLNKLSEYRFNTINMILHDFRNFTGSIQMSLDILRETNSNLTPDQQEVLGYIGIGNDKIKYLSEKMASSATSDKNEIEYNYSLIDLGKEVEQATMNLNDAATIKQIKLQLNIDPSPTMVHLDKLFLDQLLIKLFTNVLRYSSSNTIITVHLHKLDGKAIVDLANKGKLLGDEKLNELFNYHDINDANLHELISQTASGFAVSKKLAEQMGGKLTYNSNEMTGNFYRLEFNLSK